MSDVLKYLEVVKDIIRIMDKGGEPLTDYQRAMLAGYACELLREDA